MKLGRTGAKFHFAGKKAERNPCKDNPGPSHYEPTKSSLSKVSYSFAKKYTTDLRNITPGPNAYNIPTKNLLSSSASCALLGNAAKLSDTLF